LEAIEAAVIRAERDGALFRKVLAVTEKNVPNDPAHLARLDKVLMTVDAELVEAKTMEKVVEFELKHLSTQELPQLKVSVPSASGMCLLCCDPGSCVCA
jgi:hypothetical protein